MKLKYNFVVQEVADDYVALPVGVENAKFGGLVRMNKTGAFLFEQLKEDTSEEILLSSMVKKYDADMAALKASLDKFLAKLREEELLVE